MKWLAAALLIANVAVYLWVGGRGVGVDQAAVSANSGINKEGMLLLNEIPAARQAAAEYAGLSCYRIGPFKEDADWRAAKQWMRAQEFAYQAVRSESRKMRAVKVYLGPFDSLAAAKRAARRLADKGIDHFTNVRKGGEARVSLGYFTQEELAMKFVAYLLSRGIEANWRPEYQSIGPFDWIETSLDPASGARLSSRRWLGNAAAAIKIDCREITPPTASEDAAPS